ncbi:hypothetical protein ACLB2K_032713 [Fragaria x ananassa]
MSIMALHFPLAAVLLLLSAVSTVKTAAAANALPGCSDKCGDLTVPYPFGMKEGCYLRKEFFINCDHSTQPPTANLRKSNIVVTNISLQVGELRILNYVARNCYNAQGNRTLSLSSGSRLTLDRQLPFTVSDSKNKFYAVGCDTYAIMRGFRGDTEVKTGCMSICNSLYSVDSLCSGIGCCQINIPSGLNNVSVQVSSYDNHKQVWSFNPCSYAFIAEQGQFNFNSSSFKQLNDTARIPADLNWAIGNETDPCDQAYIRKDFVCKANSKCSNRPIKGSVGYLCECLPGYDGNPYHPDGCKGIDYCTASNPCLYGDCVNQLFPQNYTCACHKGYKKDRTNAQSCIKDDSSKIVLLLTVSLELEKATNNYHESRVLGEGGYGTVYKGILPDDTVVAIKKSKVLGTFGYLDPEYMQSNQLTEKSDVYSFGVVLVELQTSKVPISKDRCLASIFLASMEEDWLDQILDNGIVNEGNIGTVEKVANLAKRCLRVKGEERPTMKEVAKELEEMSATAKHPWEFNANFCEEDNEYLLESLNSGSHVVGVEGDCSSSGLIFTDTANAYDSMQNQLQLMPYGGGR